MPNAQPVSAVTRAKFIVGANCRRSSCGRHRSSRRTQSSRHARCRPPPKSMPSNTSPPSAPRRAADGLPLTLPGTLQGINEATVYARSNGYILRWLKDIGSEVAKGELLAIIAAPEIDEELSQAIAAQQQAASGESLAKSTAERWKSPAGKRFGVAAGFG